MIGDCPDFAVPEQNGTVPFSEIILLDALGDVDELAAILIERRRAHRETSHRHANDQQNNHLQEPVLTF
jgi:hypothetical protein